MSNTHRNARTVALFASAIVFAASAAFAAGSTATQPSTAAAPTAATTSAPAAVTAPAPETATAPAPKAHASQKVKDAKEALNKSGADLKVDGILGPKTREAIKSFQTAHSLKVTGKLDVATEKALKAL